MKKLVLISFLIGLGIIYAYPQDSIISIPDTAFLNALIDEGVDINRDSLISRSEAEDVTSLDISDKGISELIGIKVFNYLDSLCCSRNLLSNLEVSGFTALKYLDCSINRLGALDVSMNTALSTLICKENKLTALNVSNNTALTYLNCRGNRLASLDVSNITALTYLNCGGNPITNLDMSKNLSLEELHCDSDLITGLDVSKNTALKIMYCLFNQLTTLDVTKNTALEVLFCSYNHLTTLDVSNNITLKKLDFSYNHLTTLDVSKNTALTSLGCSWNQLTSLDVSYNTALTSLGCSSNRFTTLDVSKNTALTSLGCSSNRFTTLDVSKNTALTSLGCSWNQLTSLDVSKNTALRTLDITGMSNLYEVCVWTIPFPPVGVYVDKSASHNVYYADCIAPDLILSNDSWYQPEFIEATNSEDGWIYLVPEGTEHNLLDIKHACIGDSIIVSAGVSVEIPIPDTLKNGVYWLYARDSTGNISEAVELSIMGVGIEYNMAEYIRIYPNPINTLLTIETSISDNYNIEITSLNGQLIFRREMEGTSHQIDLSFFQKGVYFITIRSQDFVTTRKIIKL